MDGQIQVIELGDSIGFRPLEAGNVRAVCGRYAQPSPPEIGKGEAEADRDHHRLLTLILGPHLAGPTHQPIGWDASGPTVVAYQVPLGQSSTPARTTPA